MQTAAPRSCGEGPWAVGCLTFRRAGKSHPTMMGGVLQDRDARGVNCVPDYEAVGKGHIGVWGD